MHATALQSEDSSAGFAVKDVKLTQESAGAEWWVLRRQVGPGRVLQDSRAAGSAPRAWA